MMDVLVRQTTGRPLPCDGRASGGRWGRVVGRRLLQAGCGHVPRPRARGAEDTSVPVLFTVWLGWCCPCVEVAYM